MPRGFWSAAFPIFVLIVAGYAWHSSQAMPAVVASHFGPSGQANGFMPRDIYGRFMAVLIVAVPLLVVYLPNALIRRAPGRINLPHRDYWLAPERRDDTIERLCSGSFGLGYLLVAFLGYVHHLVVLANLATPPGLPSASFVGALVAFVVGMAGWAYLYLRRFFRVPR